MQEILNNQINQLNSLLRQKNLKIVGGTELFTLIKSDNAQDLYKFFGRAGILVRRFKEQKKWLRIGLPGSKQDWDRFTTVLNQHSNTINNMDE